MTQSWIIYSVSNGSILCYGHNIDVDEDQAKIDAGDDCCTLYMIQQLCAQNADLGVLYGLPSDIDPLATALCEVDHAQQLIVDMPISDIRTECKRLANNDILVAFTLVDNIKNMVLKFASVIGGAVSIIAALNNYIDELKLAKSTIDTQIDDLVNHQQAVDYYNQKSWLAEFPAPVEWEGI